MKPRVCSRYPCLFAALLIVALALAVAIGREATEYARARQAAWQAAIDNTNAEIEVAATELERLIRTGQQAADETAALVRSSPKSADHISEGLRKIVARYPEVMAAAVAFDRYGFDPERRLFAPFAVRGDAGLRAAQLDDDLDYTGSDWFLRASAGQSVWQPPRHNEMTNTVTVDFAAGDKLHDTVVAVHVSLNARDIQSVLERARLGGSGRATLVSDGGQIIAAHPGRQTPCIDASCHRVTRSIANTTWTLTMTADRRDAMLPEPLARQTTLTLTSLSLCLLATVAALHLLHLTAMTDHRANRELWTWSIVISLSFVIGIGVIWSFALSVEPARVSPGRVIASRGELEDFQRQTLIAAVRDHRPIPQFLPTGVFIKSMEFVSANNVVVTGYIWQRFKAGSKIGEGFTLPEAESVEIEEAYRRETPTAITVGWSFRVTLRQTFGYSRFPLDWEAVWIRLWPKEIDQHILLAPDLEDYPSLAGATLPGIERDIVIGGWTPRSAFFEYRDNAYSARFGLPSRSIELRPELYFNLIIQRTFLDAFVSHMTPIILVLVLIFAMQMTVTREAKNKDLVGFTASTIITTCAALFFAVLLSHIELRGALAAKKVFYVEYFYFLTYLIILLACVNSILFTSDREIRSIHYRDNLLPKLFYWPLVSGAMYAITAAVFA